ncbi:MAG: SGNH/GDSL hydrolase family protein [Planctomycetes bacterium]|nr:SGNH/GDSL hydrolase family protein [Planctomycetota bacterium]
MNRLSASVRAAVMIVFLTAVAAVAAAADAPAVCPTDPPSLAVKVGSTTLTFDAPEIRDWASDGAVAVPPNYDTWFDPWDPWPGQGKPIVLGPRRDPTGTQILGGLFRAVLGESVVVTSEDGSRTFAAGTDYRLNADWGQIANLNGGLGKEGEAKVRLACRYATQRLDLIQRDAQGNYSVKKGQAAIVCPDLPQADAGCTAVAGVYVAPWRQGGAFAITAENILPIRPAPPVAPINPEGVASTLAGLRAGREVKIAIMGDSITEGAESTRWWDKAKLFTERDLAYRGRVIHALRERFPNATVTPVECYKGGTTTQYGLEQYRKVVVPAKPDLVLIAFGANDAASSIGGQPRNSPERFKELIGELVAAARADGTEVMLITTMQQNPWLKNEVARRLPRYRQVLVEIGQEQEVAVADVYTEWMNMATRGVPPFSMLHNWINHPGDAGHKVYADTILRFFPAE